MTESYKVKSKIATAIAFLAALISYLGKDGLTQFIPEEYAFLIPILVFCAGYVLTQKTENKRVQIAEQLIEEKYTTDAEPDSENISGDKDDI